jgi:hypothetical protein
MGELLLRPAEALKLLHDLEKAGAHVLGVGTWIDVTGGIMETLQGLVVKSVRAPGLNAAEARAFILNVVPSLNVNYVSFVVDED